MGRLPVNTLAEANTVVNKIIDYDEAVASQPWQRQAVFVAGPSTIRTPATSRP